MVLFLSHAMPLSILFGLDPADAQTVGEMLFLLALRFFNVVLALLSLFELYTLVSIVPDWIDERTGPGAVVPPASAHGTEAAPPSPDVLLRGSVPADQGRGSHGIFHGDDNGASGLGGSRDAPSVAPPTRKSRFWFRGGKASTENTAVGKSHDE